MLDEKRKNYVCGSEISCLFGYNPFLTNVDLYKIKIGEKKPHNIDPSLSKRGHEREQVIYDFINDKEAILNIDNKFFYKNDNGATPDAYSNTVVYEYKTYLLSDTRKKLEQNTIPNNYILQILNNMYVMDRYTGILVVEYYRTAKEKDYICGLDSFLFKREEWEAVIFDIALKSKDFMNCVRNKQIPDLKCEVFDD